jgi:uncharacterized protein (DUF58 family)
MRIVLLILAPLMVLAIALAGSHILVERLFILIALVMIASYLFARFSLRGLKGRLKNPGQHYLPGQSFRIEASIENPGRWPRSFLHMQVITGIARRDKRTAVDLPSGAVFSWQDQTAYPHRGLYRLGPLVIEASDPFGLFRLKRVVDSGKDVIICPSTQDLPFFQAESGPLRNKLMSQEAGAFSGIREYVPGDSFNRIHWRSTAHSGKLIVKEFDVDRSERLWVLPDLNKAFYAGKGMETTSEYIITIAASIVRKYADAGRPTGLIAQNDSYHYYPARSGNMNMWRIMEGLAVMQADGEVPLPRVIYRMREQMSGNSVVILITASDRDEIADSIISAGKQGVQAVAILVDTSSFGGKGSSTKIQRRLSAMNIPAYIVRQGDNLADVLDSRRINLPGLSGNGTRDVAA